LPNSIKSAHLAIRVTNYESLLSRRIRGDRHQQFGNDGFDDAVARIRRIEKLLGLADLAHYTAPVLDAGL
jgi:hypothetical protein